MKKVVILAIATVVFASCTRDYTCACVNPETNETNQMTYQTNRKAHATRLCNDWEGRIRSAIPTKSAIECKIQ